MAKKEMTLEELYELARKLPPPTPEQERAFRISWVYGQLACTTNHRVSRELVERVVDEMDREKAMLPSRAMPRAKPYAVQSERKRKLVTLTLSDAARAKLDAWSRESGDSKSEIVDRLIVEAKR